MSTLQNQLAAQEREDISRGIRALLRNPWLTQANDPLLYEVIRRRHAPLVQWFDHTLGWPLIMATNQGYVRLMKRPANAMVPDDLRPARRERSGRAPFDRQRYVLLCVVAAELFDLRVATVGELADRVVAACASTEALPTFQTDKRDHRRAYVDVLLKLEDWGVIAVVDGQTQGYADDAAAAVLFRVVPQALHDLLSSAQGPSLLVDDQEADVTTVIERLTDEAGYGPQHRESALLEADVVGEPARPTQVQRTRWAKHSFMRRLFDDAVVYFEDVTPAEVTYANSSGGRTTIRQAAEHAGFGLEERAEGLLLVDPDRSGGPEEFPAAGAVSAAGLHIITHLHRVGAAGVRFDDIVRHVAQLMEDNPNWARTYQHDEGPQLLVTEALALLSGHQLVHADADHYVARPAAARYRASRLERRRPKRPAEPLAEQGGLFDEETQ